MKKIKILSLLVCLVAFLSACQNEDFKPSYGARTVLVYIAGNNSLGRYGFAEEDMKEMIEGMKNTDGTDNNLLVYFADYNKTAKLVRLIKNEKGEVKQETIMHYDKQNSVSVDVMKDVFQTTFSNYPAKSYGVVFWSHGEGWLNYQKPSTRWWGQDVDSEDCCMNIPDLHAALTVAPHFDFILFDACFMQSVEVAYELKDRADYIIGSPTEIPAPGAPYQKVVPAMFANTATAIEIAKAYFDFYADKDLYTGSLSDRWQTGDPWTAGVSVSVVNTSMLEQLANSTYEIIPKYIKDGKAIAISNIFCYDCRYNTKYYYDFDGLMRSLGSESSEYATWKSAYDAAVPYWKTTPNNYSSYIGSFPMNNTAGLSTYIFRKSNEKTINPFYRQSVQWYSAAGWNETGW